jgi:hypothetical protein
LRWPAAGLVVVAGPVQAQQKFTLKGQSSHPATSNFHLIFKLWADQMEKMSGGRFKAETQPGGAIVPPFEVFDAVSKGVLDVGMITVRVHPGPQHGDDSDVARPGLRHGRLRTIGAGTCRAAACHCSRSSTTTC